MLKYFGIYFGLGLIGAIIHIIAYWNAHGYSKKEKINGAFITFITGPAFIIYWIGMWFGRQWLNFKKNRGK